MLPILTDLNKLIENKMQVVNDAETLHYDFGPEDMEVILTSDLMEVILKHQLSDSYKFDKDELEYMIKTAEAYLLKLRQLYKTSFHHITVSFRAKKHKKIKLPDGFILSPARTPDGKDLHFDEMIPALVRVPSLKMKRKKAIKLIKKIKHLQLLDS